MSNRPKRVAKLVKASAEVQKERDCFEKQIRELFAFSREILCTASITSLETLEDPWKQDCISFYAGRKAIYLAKAVERHPDFFHAKPLPELDDLLAVFALAQISRKKDKELFDYWQSHYNSMTAWDIIEEINVRKGRSKRISPTAIVIRSAKVKFTPDLIEVEPVGQRVAGRSDGTYRVELDRRKKEAKDG